MEKSRIAAFDAAVAAFSPLAGHPLPQAALTAAFEDYAHSVPAMNNIYAYENRALAADAPKRTLAQTVLLNLATSTVNKGKEKEYAQKAIEKIWAKPGERCHAARRHRADQSQEHGGAGESPSQGSD